MVELPAHCASPALSLTATIADDTAQIAELSSGARSREIHKPCGPRAALWCVAPALRGVNSQHVDPKPPAPAAVAACRPAATACAAAAALPQARGPPYLQDQPCRCPTSRSPRCAWRRTAAASGAPWWSATTIVLHCLHRAVQHCFRPVRCRCRGRECGGAAAGLCCWLLLLTCLVRCCRATAQLGAATLLLLPS